MPHSIELPQLQGQGQALTRLLQGALRYGLCHACCTKGHRQRELSSLSNAVSEKACSGGSQLV